MKRAMIAILAGIITALFLAPGAAVAEKSCTELCIEAGTENLEECVQACEDYISSEVDAVNPGCFVNAIISCGLNPKDISQLINEDIACLKFGFHSSECHDGHRLCELDETCVRNICCAATTAHDCLSNWKKYCNK